MFGWRPNQTDQSSGAVCRSVIGVSLSDFLCNGRFGKCPGAVLTTAPGFLHFGDASRGTRERRQEMMQFIAQDERSLPALASLKAAFCDGLINFSAADSGDRASLRNGKCFALQAVVRFTHLGVLQHVRDEYRERCSRIDEQARNVGRKWPETTYRPL